MHFWAFFSFLRLLLGHDFIVFMKVQEIFKFCEVFEATKKKQLKKLFILVFLLWHT